MDMTGILLVALILGGMIVQVSIAPSRMRRKLRNKLSAQFGHEPSGRSALDDIDRAAIRYYFDKKHEHPGPVVDDITWSDLDMDRAFERLSRVQSDVGEQVLYATLRELGTPDEVLARRAMLAQALVQDESARANVMTELAMLGMRRYQHVVDYLVAPERHSPGNVWGYICLAALPFVLLGLSPLAPAMALLAVAALVLDIIVYYSTHKQWERETESVGRLCAVLRCAKQLSRLDIPLLEPELAPLRDTLPTLRSAAKWAQLFMPAQDGLVGMLLTYIKIVLQLDMISLSRLSKLLVRSGDALLKVYDAVGMLDVLTTSAWLCAERDEEGWCPATFHSELRVEAVDVVHPLLASPVPNTFVWEKNVLITGSNASGKSTFTKAMAISAITAQTLGVAFARSFSMCRAQVLSSMAIRDDVLRGESYFVAEVRSLGRILDAAARGDVPALCFIDEILRGTNTIERVAASTALLRYLGHKRALVLAATHDIELTRAVQPGYRNIHFRERLDGDRMVFSYKLHEGPSNTRNAIALMRQMGFPAEVTREAMALAGNAQADAGSTDHQQPIDQSDRSR